MQNPADGTSRGFQHEPALRAPALLRRWWVWVLLGAALLIPFFLPISPGLRRHPIIGALGEQLHIPLLACLTLLLYWQGPLRGRLWLTAMAAAVLGAAIELVQQFVGRSALIDDWFLDLVGIGLVVGFVLWRGHGVRQGKWLVIALLVYIPAQLWYLPFSVMAKYEARLTFPVLADFDGKHSAWLWADTNGSAIALAQVDSTRGQVLRITAGPPHHWPGARMVHFPADWTAHDSLVFEARFARPARGPEQRFHLRIDDFQSRRDKAWVTESFAADTRWQTYTLPIKDHKVLHGERTLDLADVELLLFFIRAPEDSCVLEIDNIRLQ